VNPNHWSLPALSTDDGTRRRAALAAYLDGLATETVRHFLPAGS
jgi:hypothetical protein